MTRQGKQSAVFWLKPGQRLAAARRWVVAQSANHGVQAPVVDLVELLASEVVTNARRHGRADAPVVVRLVSPGPGAVHVSVTDRESRVPRLLRPPPGSLGGRGMWLVHHSAAAWGVRSTTIADGKTVWFQVGRADPFPTPSPAPPPEVTLTVADGMAHLTLAGTVHAPGRVSGLFVLGAATRLPVRIDCNAVQHVDPVVIAALQDVIRRHAGTRLTLSAPAMMRATLERTGILALFSSPVSKSGLPIKP